MQIELVGILRVDVVMIDVAYVWLRPMYHRLVLIHYHFVSTICHHHCIPPLGRRVQYSAGAHPPPNSKHPQKDKATRAVASSYQTTHIPHCSKYTPNQMHNQLSPPHFATQALLTALWKNVSVFEIHLDAVISTREFLFE